MDGVNPGLSQADRHTMAEIRSADSLEGSQAKQQALTAVRVFYECCQLL